MDSSLRARFEQLGPIRAVDRVSSGSPAAFVLRLPNDQMVPKTISGMMALARRGLTMLQAKRAIETLLEDGRVFIDVPIVEDEAALADELAAAGIYAMLVENAASP
jgi:putative transcriptional regulator